MIFFPKQKKEKKTKKKSPPPISISALDDQFDLVGSANQTCTNENFPTKSVLFPFHLELGINRELGFKFWKLLELGKR